MKAISTSSGNSFFIPSMKLFSKAGASGSSCSGFVGAGFGGAGFGGDDVSCSVTVDSFFSSLDGAFFFSRTHDCNLSSLHPFDFFLE